MGNIKLPDKDLYLGDAKIYNSDGSVVTPAVVGTDAVTTIKIKDLNVTDAKLATDIKVGSLGDLNTSEGDSVVGAINEVDTNADAAAAAAVINSTNIGTLTSLTTTEKTNLVGAINEVNAENSGQVTLTGAQTLTNKKLTTPVISDGDAGLTITSTNQTNASATATVPDIVDAADEFVMKDTTQTLTGKTLTSPKIVTTGCIADGGGDEYVVFTESTTPKTYIGITQGDTGVAPQVRGAGETNTDLLLAGTGTGDVYIGDGADVTKDITFELVGATTGKTMTIASSHDNDRTLTLPNATDTLVGKATTDTLTNKTLTSPTITTMLIDDSDAGLTVTSADQTHATPTATIPDIGDAADEFVMKDTAQTLTVKTLTSPTLTTPKIATTGAIVDAGGDEYIVFTEATTPKTYIGITSGDTGVAPQVRGAGETNTDLLLAGTGTGNVYIGDGADVTKDINFELNGATTGKTMTIICSQSDDRSLTLPDASDTLIGKDTTDTLTNKTLTSPKINEDVVLAATSTTLDVAATKSTYGARLYYLGTPELDDDDQIVTITNMKVGTYTIAANPDVPRVVTLTHAAVGAVDTLGTVTIVGTDSADEELTEVLTPVNGTKVTGTKAFKTVTSATGAGWVISEGNDTLIIGTGPALGLPEASASISTTNTLATFGTVPEVGSAVGTGSEVSTTTVTLSSALDGSAVMIFTSAA